ncbi:unnamed protein product [Rhizophagus irregularis]|nr:unnamed protein product [Rhizophagus irregularis]
MLNSKRDHLIKLKKLQKGVNDISKLPTNPIIISEDKIKDVELVLLYFYLVGRSVFQGCWSSLERAGSVKSVLIILKNFIYKVESEDVVEGNNLELPNDLTTLMFHQIYEYYGVQDLGQDGDELEEDDYNETTLQPKRIANLAYCHF